MTNDDIDQYIWLSGGTMYFGCDDFSEFTSDELREIAARMDELSINMKLPTGRQYNEPS